MADVLDMIGTYALVLALLCALIGAFAKGRRLMVLSSSAAIAVLAIVFGCTGTALKQAEIDAAAAQLACRADLQCWGDKHRRSAEAACVQPIERMGPYGSDWRAGFLGDRLTHFRWRDQERGMMTYFGDKISYQNEAGAWLPHVYECDYDTITDAVVEVRARRGQL